MHQGVGIIILNENKDRCFIQEKDEHYPIERFRNHCSFFGGKIEVGEAIREGLIRELQEEIEMGNMMDDFNIAFVQSFLLGKKEPFEFHFFEAILSNQNFDTLTMQKVLEGKGRIMETSLLLEHQWIWGLEAVVEHYLGLHDSTNNGINPSL